MTPFFLASTNATLNSLACLFLVLGYYFIKQKKIKAHKRSMLSAFCTSALFLICYLYYHFNYPPVGYNGRKNLAALYYFILISHIILAVTVPFLSSTLLYFAFKNKIAQHKRLARYAFPIWLYVSITGVIIYFFLYHLSV